MAGPRPLRLFFALWPDEAQRQRLAELATAMPLAPGGRRVPPSNLHVTIAFLGSVPADRVPALQDISASHDWPAVDLTFDRLAVWPRARLWCLEAPELPPAFQSAVESFHDALRSAGFVMERRPFRAHVTLARNLPAAMVREERPVPPFAWPVRGVELVLSTPTREGSAYEVLGRA